MRRLVGKYDGSGKEHLGKWGEEYAARYLNAIGYTICERNYRCGRYGEIDIIAKDSNTLIFVEVKTRRSRSYGAPEEAIHLRKQQQIRKLAEAYLAEFSEQYDGCRFDVICIEVQGNGHVRLRHLKNAF